MASNKHTAEAGDDNAASFDGPLIAETREEDRGQGLVPIFALFNSILDKGTWHARIANLMVVASMVASAKAPDARPVQLGDRNGASCVISLPLIPKKLSRLFGP